jgi:hypothetical protein
MAPAVSKANEAVWHVLRAIRDDGRKAYLMGLGTQSFTLLTEAHAEANSLDVEQFRQEFWRQCNPVRVRADEA